MQSRLGTMRTQGSAAAVFVLLLTACPPSPTEKAPEPAECTDTCESLGHQCGAVCGQECGTCGQDDEGHSLSCVRGRCHCVPQCGANSCGQDDGCGYQCPCAEDVSCEGCALKLVKLSQRTENGVVEEVSVALVSGEMAALPRLADLVLTASPAMVLDRVQLGTSLGTARKLLHRFTGTNLPFQKQADGSWRVLVLAGPRNAEIEAGRWLVFSFKRDSTVAHTGPVQFKLVKRPGVLAPSEADAVLQATAYDSPLAVSPTRW